MKDTIMSLLDEWRIWVLIAVVALSLVALFRNPFASGVEVSNIDDGSPFSGKIQEGDRIVSINGKPIESQKDLMEFENHQGTLNVQTPGQGVVIVQTDGTGLGISVEKKSIVKLNFGMDLVGGTRVLLEPQFEEDLNSTQKGRVMDETITTLETRLNVFGLEEMEFERLSGAAGDYIQIEAAGIERSVVRELLERTGNFEAYIPRNVTFGNGTEADFVLGEEKYTLTRKDSGIYYNDKVLEVNDTFTVTVEEGHVDEIKDLNVTFEVWNKTDDSITLAALIYTSEDEDIKHVYKSGQDAYVRERTDKKTNFYEFRFKLLVSGEGAKRFALLTEGQPNLMHLFLDGEPVTQLGTDQLEGQVVREPWITGSRETKEQALEEMARLQSVLDSGELPVELKQVQMDSISPRLGEEMLRSSLIAGIGAVLAITILIFLIYRRVEIIVPVLLTSMSEVLIILGVASLINWTIDLAAIAGVIAAIGSSVDDQIVITSETIRKEEEDKKTKYSMKRRIKRAFFIVFTAAATTIMAMTVLGFVGIGMMRGFAITTIIGVLGGVLVTRPAYGRMLEEVL